MVLDFLAVDNFDFTRKIVQKIGMKNSWKRWGFVKIEKNPSNSNGQIVKRKQIEHFDEFFRENVNVKSWSTQLGLYRSLNT